MGHCGPIDPCTLCRQHTYDPAPEWAQDPDRPGSYILNRDLVPERKSRRRPSLIVTSDRLPVQGTSRRQALRRASTRKHRTS